MHHHGRDTHVLVDEKGDTLPTSGTQEEMRQEAEELLKLGHGPVELRKIGQEPDWHWESVDWGD